MASSRFMNRETRNTFRPPTPMVVLAWIAKHGALEQDRVEASALLVELVLEAADAMPAPAPPAAAA